MDIRSGFTSKAHDHVAASWYPGLAFHPRPVSDTTWVVSPLGAGGMGEVYRATDTKLGREVAIKLLPGAFAADPDRLARFEREAKVLASLDHPGIAHSLRLRGRDAPRRDDRPWHLGQAQLYLDVIIRHRP